MGKSLDWDSIDAAARQLGVTATSLEQWHTRGYVPYPWRLPLIREGGLPLDTEFGTSPKRATAAA